MRLLLPRDGTRTLLVLALLGVLAACGTVGPDYRLPENSVYARVQQQKVALQGHPSGRVDVAAPALEGRWWQLYRDPYLNSLIERALRDNAELRVAEAHLLQARARYQQALAVGTADWSLDAAVNRSRISAQSLLLEEQLPPFNLAEANLGVSYQLDLFGQIRRGVEQAGANTQAFMAAKDLARINVAAAVAAAYLGICHSNHELAVAEHSLQLQKNSRRVAARLHGGGRGTSTEVARADAQVAALQAVIPPLQAGRKAEGYQLAALLDLTPDQVPQRALACHRAPDLDRPIPVGDGAALLRRRPDVRRAERELAAATAGVGVAMGDLYPKVGFGASLGANGLLEDFGKPVSQQFSIGPLISWSIPGRGSRARVKVVEAGAQASLAEFDRVVLNALRETQTQLDQYAEDLRRAAALREARDRSAAAAADERRLYQSGRHPYLEHLDAERSLASEEASLARAESQLSQDQIKLFLALGGGWRGAGAEPPAESGRR